MQIDGAHDEMQVWRWSAANAGAELLYLRRGLAQARKRTRIRCGCASFVAYFACNRFAFAMFMDKGARQHDKRGEAGQRSSSYVREHGPITDFFLPWDSR